MTRTFFTILFLVATALTAVAQTNTPADYDLKKGIEEYAAENYDEALKRLAKASTANPKSGKAWSYTARTLYVTDQYEKALDACDKAIRFTPKKVKGEYVYNYNLRGNINTALGNYDAALADYNVAIKLDPENPEGFTGRGQMFAKKGDYSAARADFNTIVGLCDGYAEGYKGLGDVASREGNHKEAVEHYSKYLRIASHKREEVYLLRAAEYASIGQLHEATDDIVNAIIANNTCDATASIADLPQEARRPMLVKLQCKQQRFPGTEAWSKHIEALNRLTAATDSIAAPADATSIVKEVAMTRVDNAYRVPCKVNGVALTFVYDSQATESVIDALDALFFLKNDYVTMADFAGKGRLDSNGQIPDGTQLMLKSITFGDFTLDNVTVTVRQKQKAPLVLGTAVMNRLGTAATDNARRVLTITQKQ